MEQRILEHLLNVGSITSWEAIKEYGCTRLSQYIYLLRNKGHQICDRQIASTNRYGDKIQYKEYYLKVDKVN